jgi:uncharacterized Zn finger protein (UPF0148 family)
MKTEDEVMASVLLTGGKMLSVTCEDCGAPLFEVDGKQCCVVCRELGKPGDSQETKPNLPEKTEPEMPPVQERGVSVDATVVESIEQAICALSRKAAEATRPEDAQMFMDAVRAGTKALRDIK